MGKKILLAVDGSESNLKAISVVGQLLKDQKDCEILLLHCVQPSAMLYPGELAGIQGTQGFSPEVQQKHGNSILDAARRMLTADGFPADLIRTELHLGCTDPAQDILSQTESEGIRTIVVGRRGRSSIENLLLGSVSSKVAQYSRYKTVWIVDAPVHQTRKVLVAIAGVPDSRALTYYTVEYLASIPEMHYTLLHIMPPIPPTFWDNGHILAPDEQKDRQVRIERWRAEWIRNVEKFMDEACHALVAQGVPSDSVERKIVQTKEGIARDLLNDITREEYQVVVMGKRSFDERKPFLMGSHANKILQNIKKAILCLVDAAH